MERCWGASSQEKEVEERAAGESKYWRSRRGGGKASLKAIDHYFPIAAFRRAVYFFLGKPTNERRTGSRRERGNLFFSLFVKVKKSSKGEER